MALILQCWFDFFFPLSPLNAEILVLYQHCGQRLEIERLNKEGWLRGSGWMMTRWDTGAADGQIFAAWSLHHGARQLAGWRTPTIQSDMTDAGAIHFSVL